MYLFICIHLFERLKGPDSHLFALSPARHAISEQVPLQVPFQGPMPSALGLRFRFVEFAVQEDNQKNVKMSKYKSL